MKKIWLSLVGTLNKTGRLACRSSLFVLALVLAAGVLALGANYLKQYDEQTFVAQEQHADPHAALYADQPLSTQSLGEWGSEALYALHEGAEKLSPIDLANACGLGASSCFRCHNGKRAVAPKTDASSPWHVQHAKVNYSCTGCHQGNPRVLKQEIAHKNLTVNPIAAPEKTCASCHGGDTVKLNEIYRKIHPATTQGQ